MSRTVLVPMDDSPPSEAALEHALSSYPEAEITVLYVVDTAHAVGYGDLFSLAVQADHSEERGDTLFEEARRVAERYDGEITTVAERGSPVRTILAFIDQHDVDRVVMGSHGRTGVNRLFLGSIAERVVRRAAVPVTVVPEPAAAREELPSA